MSPKQYRKKPVVIEAMALTETNAVDVIRWIQSEGGEAFMRGGDTGGSVGGTVIIRTLEGPLSSSLGDFIIRGVQGEFYACKPGIFAATYEAVSA